MRLAPLALAVLCAAVLFTGLARVGYLDEREARDAEVARELVGRQEILTPRYGDEARFEKPILGYALEALGLLLTPDAPLGGRLLRGAAAFALVLLTAAMGANLFGARAGWCAGGVLATTLGLTLAARTDGVQLVGALLGWVGCAGLADAEFGHAPGREPRLVAAYGALGAALVVAGPLPALWPLAGLALYLRLSRSRAGWSLAQPLSGLVLMLGFALPWYGAMIERHGLDFLTRAPVFPYGMQPRGPWYVGLLSVFAFLTVGAFPWSSLLPGAALHAATWWRRVPLSRLRPLGAAVAGATGTAARLAGGPIAREEREERAAHFVIAALAAALAPLLFYPSPPMPAVLPALPAVALLCGRFLDHLIEDPERVRRALSAASRMLALTGTVAAIGCVVLAPRLREAAPALRLLGSLVLVTSWAPFLADLIARRRVAVMLMALPVAITLPVANLALVPAMEDYLNTRSVAEALHAVAPPGAPVVLVEAPPPSLRFYARRNLVVVDSLPRAVVTFRAADGMTYLAFRPARESRVLRAAGHPLEILRRTPSLVLARVHPG